MQFNKVEKKLRKEFGDGNAKRVISKAVYMLSVGGNDYLAPNSTLNLSNSREEYVAMVIGNISNVIKVTYLPTYLLTTHIYTYILRFSVFDYCMCYRVYII